ncbi:cytochrome P450 [Leucosporidium creatinivorum]|uniref:Cytochrome P450 n=1 Tax=Leucosporidium creatinivorum TaxID=106004 RepID=A0A1Y2FD39_9BASI|nr:cytochrome P450 [Leucosporidium creatinivorum]
MDTLHHLHPYTEPALVVLGLGLLFLVAQSIRLAFFAQPLSSIPGPLLAKLTNNWALYHQLNGRKFAKVHEAFLEHGPVVRAGPTTVYIADYKLLNAVYQSKLDKIPAYAGFKTNRGVHNAFSSIEANVAAGRRRGMLPQYATASLLEWQETFDSHIDELRTVIEQFGPDTSIDVLSCLAHVLIDVLGEIVLDCKINSLGDYAKGKKNPIVRAITLWPKRGTIMGVLPKPVWAIISRLPYAPWQELVQSDANLADFVHPRVVAAQAALERGDAPERRSLAHRLSVAHDSHTGKLWPQADVTAECIDHFLAGTETTSTTLTYALYTLSKRPDVMATLQEELDEATPNAELIGLQEAGRLPYLNAVLKETMRLCTAGPGTFDRIAKDGMDVHGFYLPPGTVVGLQSFTLHRDPSVWGDPFVFRPERWLEETQEMKASFIPFSVGGRACPGLNLAWVDMRLLLSAIARRFNVSPAPETTDESMAPFDLATVSPMSGECKLFFEPRAL